jgi:hypothetical protein
VQSLGTSILRSSFASPMWDERSTENRALVARFAVAMVVFSGRIGDQTVVSLFLSKGDTENRRNFFNGRIYFTVDVHR